ncbi:hypothetical protein BsWGS_28101 [Bradybaena similaris]
MLQYWYLALAVTTVTTEVLWETASNNNDDSYMHKDTHNLRHFQIVHEMTKNTDQIQTVHNGPPICEITGDNANCSSRNISNIGDLHLPDNITGLDLSFNNIQDIPDTALANLTQLTSLNLSHNQIQQLNSASFYNLNALRLLNLHSNNLSMSSETFPAEVFQPLVSLTHLWINNNTNVNDTLLDYPDAALSQLSNLTYLWMDGLPNKVFGFGFQSLRSLRNLTLQGGNLGHCNLTSLPGDMFETLSSLHSLALWYCQINGDLVDSNVFRPLTNLVSLNLSKNVDLHFEPLGNALEMIVDYRNLTELIISGINNPYYPAICVTVKFAKSLPRGLEILDVTSNSMEVLEHGVLENLPKNLKQIYINDNRFAFASYLKDLDKLENLLELSIATENTHILPKYYPPDGSHWMCSNYTQRASSDDSRFLIQSLPPKLQQIEITNAGWSNYLDEFHFNPNNSLKQISLDWNNFPKLEGPIIGLNQLENISLVGCNIKIIYYTFFQNLTSLKFVNLASNLLGNSIFQPGTPSPFIWLKSLTYLDLSFSDIHNVSYTAFQGLNNLTTLKLNRNPILTFEIDLSNMTQLTFINLSDTTIASLSSQTRNMLDQIHSMSNLTVDFSGDRFDCQCENLEFIQWMTTTLVLSKHTKYYCRNKDVERSTSYLMQLYKHMLRECVTNYQLLSIVISCTCLTIIMMLAAITYRFRMKLWYLYYAGILHYTGKAKNRDNLESFDFDVFISYAHEDHEFVVNNLFPKLTSQGLKVHLHGLHFVAGQYISSNIVNAVQSSRRTLVVLTTSHVRSKWSKFEIEMANIEQVSTRRSVLLFLIMETLPKLNNNTLFHLKSNTYIKFPDSPQDQAIMQMFWSKLVSDLRS